MLDWKKNNYGVIKTCIKGRELYTEFMYNIHANKNVKENKTNKLFSI